MENEQITKNGIDSKIKAIIPDGARMKLMKNLRSFFLLIVVFNTCNTALIAQKSAKVVNLVSAVNNVKNGTQTVYKAKNGYQMQVTIASNGQRSYQMIAPDGSQLESQGFVPTTVMKKKKPRKPPIDIDKPTTCQVCYTYRDGLQICYVVPCP